jgi:Arc/MetJ-type ribon-helix-helix transcriptional regulator
VASFAALSGSAGDELLGLADPAAAREAQKQATPDRSRGYENPRLSDLGESKVAVAPIGMPRQGPLARLALLESAWSVSIYHPCGWFGDVFRMAGNVHELRPKAGSDTEKITINLGYVDLGHIDLLVQDGFYSNRTDFIRTAIRNQIERHADATKQSVARKSLDLGLRHFSREDLETARAAGQRLDIRVLGLASIAADVTPELAQATIASISVLGALQASTAVKAALADRTR